MPPSPPQQDQGALQATFAATLVDEWVRGGVTQAVVCPGSRSTPLALALAGRDELSVHVRLDERGAGFFAIGLALVSGSPTVLCVTSGTAAAELHAAVLEAHHGRVPLIVCTADRPPELQGVGAPQTVAQAGLFAPAVRWSADPGVPSAETQDAWRSLGARALVEASAGPLGPGPVHLNLAFREPLFGEAWPLPPARPDTLPFHRVLAGCRPSGMDARWAGRRGVIVAGAGAGPPGAVLALAEHLGWPLFADPRSGCRTVHPQVVAAADALARVAGDVLRPDVVVRLGTAWASKALTSLVAGAEILAVDPWWRWEDPDHTVEAVHRADPAAWIESSLERPVGRPPGGWLEVWQAAEHAAQTAIDEVLAAGGLSEPLVARRLYSMVPPDAVVVVASSMPVRDLEWFAPPVATPPRVLANRGVNGIDGVCSTAFGAASAGRGPVVAVVGDLAFFHDVSSLVSELPAERQANCTIVVVDNTGGGIFEFLPQATAVDRVTFDRVLATPQAPDVVSVAEGFGVGSADVGTPHELEAAVRAATRDEGLAVVRARVPARPGNVEVHRRIHEAVAAALEGVPELARG